MPVFSVLAFLTAGMHVDCSPDYMGPGCGYNPPILFELDMNITFLVTLVLSYILACILVSVYQDSIQRRKKEARKTG